MVRIRGATADAVSEARRMLEYTVQHVYLESEQVGWIIGKNGERINDIIKKSGVTRIEVEKQAVEGSIAAAAGGRGRRDSPAAASTPLVITGLKSAVETAVMLVELELQYQKDAKETVDAVNKLSAEVETMNIQYGDYRGPRRDYEENRGGRGGGDRDRGERGGRQQRDDRYEGIDVGVRMGGYRGAAGGGRGGRRDDAPAREDRRPAAREDRRDQHDQQQPRSERGRAAAAASSSSAAALEDDTDRGAGRRRREPEEDAGDQSRGAFGAGGGRGGRGGAAGGASGRGPTLRAAMGGR